MELDEITAAKIKAESPEIEPDTPVDPGIPEDIYVLEDDDVYS